MGSPKKIKAGHLAKVVHARAIKVTEVDDGRATARAQVQCPTDEVGV